MIFAVLPVKEARNAKQRLNGLLSAAEREVLARAMYRQMLGKLCAARGIDRILVVTSDRHASEVAGQAGALVLDEREQRGHSYSADLGARYAMELGACTVLLVPIDVPLATTEEIEELAAAARPGVLIVPSADGAGTNALVRTPADAIESRFGPGSLAKHLEQARARGVAAQVLRPPGLVFDLDTPEDVAELLARAPGSPIAQMLRAKCLSTS